VALLLLTIVLAIGGHATGAAAAPVSLDLIDVDEKGVFNMGPGQGRISRASDETVPHDVVQFNYAFPKSSVIGVWSKSFPRELNAKTVEAIDIRVKVPEARQLQEISVKVEVKGAKAVQNIPLRLTPGWNTVREPINWGTIGDLREVVFVVRPVWGAPETAEGILYVDYTLHPLSFREKHAVGLKVGGLLLLSSLMALLAALVALGFRAVRPGRGVAGMARNVLYGVAVAGLLGLALSVYAMGTVSPLQVDFSIGVLAAGVLGALLPGLLKLGLTGKRLTPAEAFQHALLTGLLAIASSRQELLQAPGGWAQVLMFNNIAAALTLVIYHVKNAHALITSGTSVRPITATLIVATPYLFNWLLLLQNTTLLQSVGHAATAGLLAARPALLELLGRFLIVFGLNEAVLNGVSLATQRRILRAPKAHLITALIAFDAIVAPLVANLGSTATVASLAPAWQSVVSILATMFSHAGLWGEVYLLTGIILDATQRAAPSRESVSRHVVGGMRKGMAYSGLFMTILHVLRALLQVPATHAVLTTVPILTGILCGALLFPFVKTIIETFDGSPRFLERVRYSYRDGTLYARGAVAGFGFAYLMSSGLFRQGTADRMLFGLLIGLLASGGMSFLRDAAYAAVGRGRLQSWRLYSVDVLLGAFVGSAAAFYLDALQIPVVVEKFRLYTSAGFSPVSYITYPLVSKWGRMDLGSYTGGVNLLFMEALAGVINWSIAAWLFAINRVIMEACFQRDRSPIRRFFSQEGFTELTRHMLYVLRWGLWMSPIIFTFLRMMPTPTWYNQDGAIRTFAAVYHALVLSPEAFNTWSLTVFTWVLASDLFRILIWMDHMGLRVATLVNLSFIGLDRLDERFARFIGPAAAQRYIPEAVKRFATWAPLLIPFYLPRGKDWEYAWNTAEAMSNTPAGPSLLTMAQSVTWPQGLLLAGLAVVACTGLSWLIRTWAHRHRRRQTTATLTNRTYEVIVRDTGEIYSQVLGSGYDVSRRAYDLIEPCGRALWLVESTARGGASSRSWWPIIGNFPTESFQPSRLIRADGTISLMNTAHGLRTTVDIRLPDADAPAELWTITLENLTGSPRRIALLPYVEWVLTRGLDDRFHTQYARLFTELQYVASAHAILAWQKVTKSMGLLASDAEPEGFLTSRVEFIGRARSLWSPRIAETLAFRPAEEAAAHPTFDPIGSLKLEASVGPKATKTLRLLIGCAKSRQQALSLIQTHLKLPAATQPPSAHAPIPRIGHGEVPPGTPQPYASYRDEGTALVVHTPYTPRPFDHAMANAAGHAVIVTNRGLHTSSNGNSQQNRLTPDWPDTVTKEVPSEAFYLYDLDRQTWHSPTYHPLNDPTASHEAQFGLDGTAVFRMTQGELSTELTVFVPPEDPLGVYLLTIRNAANQPKRLRLAAYFQMVLGFHPEQAGALHVRYDRVLEALFFENPRNMFRSGPAFVSMTLPADAVETRRGKFFGTGRSVAHPFMVEHGEPDATQITDDRSIAALLTSLEIPAHGERTLAVILGQTDNRQQAVPLLLRYQQLEQVRASLESTQRWWRSLMRTVEVSTNEPEFDWFQHWLKYQAIVERLWARRGFYQTSGAFGFRDQLQDAVNLMWVDPAFARRQILLHASQQFIEGDVFHWFFTLTDGRTAFACRSHASDNPIWLVWGVTEYLRATGDQSILDEVTSYVISENPFAPLPKNKQGWGGLYHRSPRVDTVYRHCMKSIDLVLNERMGAHGLPLIQTGDWNDGLDEIGSEGKGESVWLGFFLLTILKAMLPIIEQRDGSKRAAHYRNQQERLEQALEATWRGDRYLRAIHDDGTEIGLKDSGVWEIDALTAAWAVLSGLNPERGRQVFHTALRILERDDVVLLGWPALREDTRPYLGRSSKYPEGVRENGMYCHGVQWLIRAARLLAESCQQRGEHAQAAEYRQTAYRLWRKITPLPHQTPNRWDIYGGQPNKQPADLLTTFDQGRMIWNGYTGAAGWLLRQAFEGVAGATLRHGELVLPDDLDQPRGPLAIRRISRQVECSPLNGRGQEATTR
jgi:cyclic beta-1,2-glucan synthetase